MDEPQRIRFRIAADASEFEQIFELGYETFVDEIPQHDPNRRRRHVDRFHDENTYVVAVEGDHVVGMIALRGRRPFSLDQKLGGVDAYLPAGRRVCELRLLAVRKAYRRGRVFRGLVEFVLRHGRAEGYDLAIISGALRQARLYRHLGFVPFGPRVGTDAAPFQPMYITLEGFQARTPSLAVGRREPVSFLPGPVMLARDVRAEFARAPVSHRDAAFEERLGRTRDRLCRLAGAPHVALLLGSGTLANDVVAGRLAALDAPGVVASNGEFGDRLVDHARRWGLAHRVVSADWGAPLDAGRLERAIDDCGARWLWVVASETSTGLMNDVDGLKAIAARYGLRLALDAISAIGAVPIDLAGVWLASGASGKALASFAGLSFVFHAEPVEPNPRVPRYLDLGTYAATDGTPFTHSSNLVAALDVALERFESTEPFAAIAARAARLRRRLDAIGLPVLVAGPQASPAVLTVRLAAPLVATAVADELAEQGLLVASRSGYLVERNWMQVAVMGQCTEVHVDRLCDALEAIVTAVGPAAGQSAAS